MIFLASPDRYGGGPSGQGSYHENDARPYSEPGNSPTSASNPETDWNALIATGLTSVALFNLIIATIIGNSLVMLAIGTQKSLRTESNYLLFSLALADLLVGMLVMPLGAVQIITGQWLLGATWCEIWTFVDITCCSSSILHLLSVAIDRHLSISLVRMNWTAERNKRSIYAMITCSWAIAASVAVSPLLGWKDGGFLDRIAQQVCIVSQSISFLFFGITVTFYLPLFFLLLFYWRIWLQIQMRYRKRVGGTSIPMMDPASGGSYVTAIHTVQTSSGSGEHSSHSEPEEASTGSNGKKISISESSDGGSETFTTPAERRKQKDAKESKKMLRAAKTLAIITGVFVVCWLPRFLMLPIVAMCGDACPVNPKWADFTQWLGFSNSALNPIIYTIFSPDFRLAFKRLICRQRDSR